MRETFSKKTIVIITVVVVILIGSIIFFLNNSRSKPAENPVNYSGNIPTHEVIGRSVQGRPIDAYTYGTGKTHLLFVGGIHGGYEWNSVLLAEKFKDYLFASDKSVLAGLTITVIPSANPDGVFKVVNKEGSFDFIDILNASTTPQAPGRFNAHAVDLNRNFDCKWAPTGTWQGKTVSAGTKAFSEPETQAIRDFVLKNNITAAIFWHSQANAVYASSCNGGILPQTLDMMNIYAQAAGYPAIRSFDSYAVTGAADDWLASINIPAMTVELKTHETIEWDKNLAGIKALLMYYQNKSVL